MTLLDAVQVGEWLKCNDRVVCKWAHDGKIPARKIGREWRFVKEELEKWVLEAKKTVKVDPRNLKVVRG